MNRNWTRSTQPPAQLPMWKRRPILVVLGVVFVICVSALLIFSGGSDHQLSDSHNQLPKLQRPRRAQYSQAPESSSKSKDAATSSPPGQTPAPHGEQHDEETAPPNSVDCRHHQGACLQDGALILPHGYPVHRNLPPRSELHSGLEAQRAKKCDATNLLLKSPLINSPSRKEKEDGGGAAIHHSDSDEIKMRRSLEKQFETPLRSDRRLFATSRHDINELDQEEGPWWVPFGSSQQQQADERLPCTAEVQALLHRWQNPPRDACTAASRNLAHDHDPDLGQAGTVRGLVSELKSGAHGVGSAVTLLAHDFLSALILRRRFTVSTKGRRPWFFAPQGCEKKGGWECLFLPPTSCYSEWASGSVPVHSVSDISRAGNKRLVIKKSFDAPGLSRSDHPSIESFFATLSSLQPSEVAPSLEQGGGYHDNLVNEFLSSGEGSEKSIADKCVPLIKAWAKDPANRALMGTFRKGSDPVLIYQLSQVTAYLMRGLQPWFRDVISAHLRRIVLGNPSRLHHQKRRRPQDDAELMKSGRLPKNNNNEDGGGAAAVAADDIVLARRRGGGGGGQLLLQVDSDAAAGGAGQLEEEVRSVIFVHDRGELAKYREYYNAFGCHKLKQEAYLSEVHHLCPSLLASAGATVPEVEIKDDIVTASEQKRVVKQNKCIVFISGNMPHAEYLEMVQRLEAVNSRRYGGESNNQIVVRSTWQLSSVGGAGAPAAETARWGAAHPAASWVDLFAGMHSTGWSCIVQSNWCRVIYFIRMTLLSRAHCPFVDMGMAALADDEIPSKYCIVRQNWPMKPYSGAGVQKDFVVK